MCFVNEGGAGSKQPQFVVSCRMLCGRIVAASACHILVLCAAAVRLAVGRAEL